VTLPRNWWAKKRACNPFFFLHRVYRPICMFFLVIALLCDDGLEPVSKPAKLPVSAS
jgi:hypothetical protein